MTQMVGEIYNKKATILSNRRSAQRLIVVIKE